MKHKWICLKPPRQEKCATQLPHEIVKKLRLRGNPGPVYDLSTEKWITNPGWFRCTTCGFFLSCNYPPPEDWKSVGIIPDCSQEVVRSVQET